jgi:hypothetical protein
MEAKTFESIIKVEKEIQRMLREEQQKARDWLTHQKQEIEANLQAALDDVEAGARRAEAEVKAAAERDAAELVSRTSRRIRDVEGLDDSCLQRIIRQEIRKILPGAGDDRPDV